jgi:hypothetical protein
MLLRLIVCPKARAPFRLITLLAHYAQRGVSGAMSPPTINFDLPQRREVPGVLLGRMSASSHKLGRVNIQIAELERSISFRQEPHR